MAESKEPGPVIFFTGVLASDKDALIIVENKLSTVWGTIRNQSSEFSFDNSQYYKNETGSSIIRKFFSFYGDFDREELAIRKLQSNMLEKNIAEEIGGGLTRPVNIDPGYLAPEKLVLASCKNFAHRIYIGNGVFAEITLLYRKGKFQALEWTFPDFADTRYHEFFYQERADMMRMWY